MRVIIRADGNKEIAMGHVMRCLSIGDALREKGAEVLFVTADGEAEAVIKARGFEMHILNTSFREPEAELSGWPALLERISVDWIVVDSYFVTKIYLETLAQWCHVAYIDDMGQPVYPVDMLINYNVYAKGLPYEKWYEEAEISLPGQMLFGSNYAPLRREFKEAEPCRIKEKVTDVLITTGGGDAVNAAGGLCEKIEKEIEKGMHSDMVYHVVCGPFSENKESLWKLSEKCPAFVIHENVTHMWELMQKCDVAVSATGSTMLELCAMQLPAVSFYFAENQRQMAEYFDTTTEIKNAGNITTDRESVLENILRQLEKLEQDVVLRNKIRTQMCEITDGKGAERIADELFSNL